MLMAPFTSDQREGRRRMVMVIEPGAIGLGLLEGPAPIPRR
jgi:hypothetical protein